LARADGPDRPGVVVVPGHSGSGVVVSGGVPGRHGSRGPIVWYSIYDTYPAGPPEKRSPTQGLEVKPAGRLRLVVKPSDAQVWIDGHPLPSGADVSVGLLTGTYTVQAARDGYRAETHQVSIEQAKTANLSIQLQRQAE
jgi:hypothetical protein